eukprot:TRINITY_DN18975_c0_g1_i1.p1 TRINITY_DN18975_c0_g1~~TRINITY_DN18975_c0_g1_i1.p1  ORF type:complete len:276 (-),score=17.73 TRINITY_DN18975_c0_g1_i1:116-943(-)
MYRYKSTHYSFLGVSVLLLMSVAATRVPTISATQDAQSHPAWHPLHLHSCTLYPQKHGVHSTPTTTASANIHTDSVRVQGDVIELNPSILQAAQETDVRALDPPLPPLYTPAPTPHEYKGTLWFVQVAYGRGEGDKSGDYSLAMHSIRQQLQDIQPGVRVVQFIPPRTFVLSVPRAHTHGYIAQVRATFGQDSEHHVWIHPVHASYKVVPELSGDITTLLHKREAERTRRLHLRQQGEAATRARQEHHGGGSRRQSQQTPWHPTIDLSSSRYRYT